MRLYPVTNEDHFLAEEVCDRHHRAAVRRGAAMFRCGLLRPVSWRNCSDRIGGECNGWDAACAQVRAEDETQIMERASA